MSGISYALCRRFATLLGLGLSLYLGVFDVANLPARCGFGSCAAIRTSEIASIGGIPLAWYSFFGFLCLIGLQIQRMFQSECQRLCNSLSLVVASMGTLCGLGLTAYSVAEFRAVCGPCVILAMIWASTLALVSLQQSVTEPPTPTKRLMTSLLLETIGLTAAVAFTMFDLNTVRSSERNFEETVQARPFESFIVGAIPVSEHQNVPQVVIFHDLDCGHCREVLKVALPFAQAGRFNLYLRGTRSKHAARGEDMLAESVAGARGQIVEFLTDYLSGGEKQSAAVQKFLQQTNPDEIARLEAELKRTSEELVALKSTGLPLMIGSFGGQKTRILTENDLRNLGL